MNWIKNVYLNILLVVAFWILLLSIYDVLYGMDWIVFMLIGYIIIIILFSLIILYYFSKRPSIPITVEEFEKRLMGELYHFKCPSCSGIFAVKKSKSNDTKEIRMNCPDCGTAGVIPLNPDVIEEEIPEKKSVKASFKCNVCGEGITVWAEGTDLHKKVKVYNCPFCGEQEEPLRRL